MTDNYLSFLVPPRPNIKFPKYIAGNGHSCNTSTNQLIVPIIPIKVIINMYSSLQTTKHQYQIKLSN